MNQISRASIDEHDRLNSQSVMAHPAHFSDETSRAYNAAFSPAQGDYDEQSESSSDASSMDWPTETTGAWPEPPETPELRAAIESLFPPGASGADYDSESTDSDAVVGDAESDETGSTLCPAKRYDWDQRSADRDFDDDWGDARQTLCPAKRNFDQMAGAQWPEPEYEPSLEPDKMDLPEAPIPPRLPTLPMEPIAPHKWTELGGRFNTWVAGRFGVTLDGKTPYNASFLSVASEPMSDNVKVSIGTWKLHSGLRTVEDQLRAKVNSQTARSFPWTWSSELKPFDVGCDNNCAFLALSYALFGTRCAARALRFLAAVMRVKAGKAEASQFPALLAGGAVSTDDEASLGLVTCFLQVDLMVAREDGTADYTACNHGAASRAMAIVSSAHRNNHLHFSPTLPHSANVPAAAADTC